MAGWNWWVGVPAIVVIVLVLIVTWYAE